MIWKPVADYAGIYEVSDTGLVRSLDRHDARGWRRKGKVLAPAVHSSGHAYVALCKNGSMKSHKVHRLVLEAFVGPCPEGMECRHLDGNPSNNQLDNLKWGTRLENQQDRIEHGHTNAGRKCPSAKLPEKVALSLRGKKLAYGEQSRLARKHGVHPSTICVLVHGKTWGNV